MKVRASRLTAVILMTVLLSACSAPAASDLSKGTAKPVSDDGGVPWKDYSPDTRDRITKAATAKDCKALQGEFDTADKNNQAASQRTGHNNAMLMSYLDNLMRTAGCYR